MVCTVKKNKQCDAVSSLQHGYAVVEYPNKKRYAGQFLHGKRHGYGTLTLRNHIVYKGEWKDDVRHGIHEVTFPTSIYVTEQWNHGVRESTTIRYNNGTLYKGQCKERTIIPHGDGRMQYTNGTVYYGTFCDGEQHGYGTMTYLHGSVFRGNWQHGKEDGSGELCFNNGRTLHGTWSKGTRMGKGTLCILHGDTITMEIDHSEERDGYLYEHGTIEYSSGKRYKGELRDGEPHGKGIMYYFHGDVVEDVWNQGKRTSVLLRH